MEPNANTAPASKAGPIWQPLTFGGVASFAGGSWGRLLVVQLIFAVAVAVSVMFFLKATWFITVREAVKALPDKGAIQKGELTWFTNSPVALAESYFLSIRVNLDREESSGQVSDLQLDLGRHDLTIASLAGETKVPYDAQWCWPVNRLELGPWWGAWEPAIATLAVVAVVASLMITWYLLATVYALPVWIIGFYADREVTIFSAWRLAGAALMPGALLMTAAILFYAWHRLPLLGLGIIFAVHLVVGWIYLFYAPFLLPPEKEKLSLKTNPFATLPEATKTEPPKDDEAKG